MFGATLLMSDSSSEMTPVLANAARSSPTQRQYLGLQRQQQPPPPTTAKEPNAATIPVSENKHNLTNFFDKFNDRILNGCHEERGDADSSDVFSLNDSHFGDWPFLTARERARMRRDTFEKE